MKTLNIFISAVFLFNSIMTAAPMANANGNRRPLPPHLQEQQEILDVFEQAGLNPKNYRARFEKHNPNDPSAKRFMLIEFPESGSSWETNPGRIETLKIEIPRGTPDEKEAYRPSKIEETLLKAEALVKAAGNKGSHIVKDVTMRFPMESFKFFLAIGSVTYFNMMLAGESNDPLAFTRQIEGLADPVAHIGFYTFMIVNGVSVELLNKAFGMNKEIPMVYSAEVRNSMAKQRMNFRTFFLSNLGMTFGSLASSIVHEIAYFPHLTDCVMGIAPKDPKLKDQKSCDLAYNEFWKWDSGDRLSAEAPVLTSMILSNVASSVIMSVGQSVLNKTSSAAFAANQLLGIMSKRASQNMVFRGFSFVLRITGLSAAAQSTASGVAGAARMGLSFSGGVLIFALFVGLDQVIFAKPTARIYNSVFGGINLQAKQLDFVRALMQAKANNWFFNSDQDFKTVMKGKCETFEFYQYQEDTSLNGECPNVLELTFDRLHKKMGQWRQKQIEDITYSSENWKDLISNYMSTYDVSRSIYSYLVKEAANAAGNENKAQSSQLLYPLNGIKEQVKTSDPSIYLRDPFLVTVQQIRFLISNVDSILSAIELQHGKSLQPKDKTKFYFKFAKELKSEATFLKEFDKRNGATADGLRQRPDVLTRLNNIGKLFVGLQTEINNTNSENKKALMDLQMKFAAEPGIPPRPIMNKGEGFILYSKKSNSVPEIEGLKWTMPNQSNLMGLKTESQWEKMMVSMIWGPEPKANSGMVDDTDGFFSQGFYRAFNPPSIVNLNTSTGIDFRAGYPYTDRVVTRREADVYQTPFYLMKSGNKQSVYSNPRNKQQILKSYSSILEYLMDVNNYSFLKNTNKGNSRQSADVLFTSWWTQNVAPEYLKGWDYFQSEYKNMVFELYQRMFRAENVGTIDDIGSYNTGPGAIGLILSMKQQYRLYLSVLGDIYKYGNQFEPGIYAPDLGQLPVYKPDWQIPEVLLPEHTKDNLESYPVEKLGPEANVKMAIGLNLLSIFKQVDYLDIDWLGRKFSGHITNNGVFKFPNNSNLDFQAKALMAFDKVESLFRKIVQRGNKRLQTEVTSAQLKQAIEDLNQEIQNLKKVFIPPDIESMMTGQMDFRTRMILKIINGLGEINAELMNYGANIFAVSYKDKHAADGQALDSGNHKNCNRNQGLAGKTTDKDCLANSGN